MISLVIWEQNSVVCSCVKVLEDAERCKWVRWLTNCNGGPQMAKAWGVRWDVENGGSK